jgi:hypothetical protein
MTAPTTLLALADRCEQAAGPDQKLVMLSVLDALKLPSKQHYAIIRMIEVGAYESAAIALVPEGCRWMIMGNAAKVGRWPSRAATPALALCAAALRARAAACE